MRSSWSALRSVSLAGLSPAARVWFHTVRWSILLGIAAITHLAFPTTGSLDIPSYRPGTFADREVVAPMDVTFWQTIRRVQENDDGRRPSIVVDSIEHVIHAGDLVVSPGDRVTRETAFELAALADAARTLSRDDRLLQSIVGPILFNALILSIFWLLLMMYRWETYAQLREMLFFGFLLSLVVVVSALFSRFLPERPELVPVPFLTIIVTLLYNGRIGLFAGAVAAILIGSQWAFSGQHGVVFILLAGTAAALGTRVARRRKELYFTIFTVVIAYALAALTLGLLFSWTPGAMWWSIVRGSVTALGSAAVALLILPLAESATRITTDITLLELSDPSQPLLRRLSLEAPGTWAHSLAMGNLCESACNAIGANGLLARVGALYHDIGKAPQPRYFVENQDLGTNPHDELGARESAGIVRQHVIEGVQMARAAGLPEPVVAFIPEHHGTMTMDYFLDRAKREGGTVNPEEFRYPGPRPRTPETAVAMLADSAEAAVRMLGNPTPERVRSAVEFLIKQRVDDGQLKDAPLTLSDLDRVKEEFVRVISSMHHARVGYPGDQDGFARVPRRSVGGP